MKNTVRHASMVSCKEDVWYNFTEMIFFHGGTVIKSYSRGSRSTLLSYQSILPSKGIENRVNPKLDVTRQLKTRHPASMRMNTKLMYLVCSKRFRVRRDGDSERSEILSLKMLPSSGQ